MMNGDTDRAPFDDRAPVTDKAKSEPLAPLAVPLTERELEILCLVAQDWTNQQIAAELVVAHSTVRWYLRQIYAKLGVGGREEAVARAWALGLAAKAGVPPRARTNLRAAPSAFFGRQPELQALGDLLLSRRARLVTICGPGGIGKTRLALALAERQVDRYVPGSSELLFPDGVWFISLAPAQAAAEALAAVAQAVGFQKERRGAELRPPQQEVLAFLRRKRLLLVLDNVEHLPDVAPFLAEIARAAPENKLVVTSRRRLNLREEHLFPLAGLPVPADERAADAAAAPAVHLFLETARRVQPALVGDDESLAAAVRICRLLEGMPLAIELAAAWAGILLPVEIEQEVRRGLDILVTELADVEPRHRSMQATLDVSWNQLGGAERDVFRQLSVFRGGFSREAACAVAGATLPVLKRLVDASWLSFDQEADRFEVQELLRQYGEARLQEVPALEQETRARHAAYYAAFLHSQELAWFGPAQQQVLAAVHREMANARRAWRWAVAHGRVDLLAAALESIALYYRRHGDELEVRELLQLASASLLQETVPVADDIAKRRLLARLYTVRGIFVRTVEEALVWHDQAERVLQDLHWEAVDVRQEEANLMLERGAYEWESNPRAARPLFARALSLFEQTGDAPGVAYAAQRLAAAALLVGEYRQAIEPAREALERHRMLDNAVGVTTVRRLLGCIERERGRLAEALQLHEETTWGRRKVDEYGAALGAFYLVETLAWTGAYTEAHDVAVEALQQLRELGVLWWDTVIRSKLVLPLLHMGRYDEAQQMTDEVIEKCGASGQRQLLGWTWAVAGQCAHASGRYADALAALDESAAVLKELGHAGWMLGLAYEVYPLLKLGETTRARSRLAYALDEHGDAGLFFFAINAVPAAARLLAEQGDVERAVELYALACTYPYVANSCWYEDVVGCELAQAATTLPPAIAAAAQARGQARALWTTVEELNCLLAVEKRGDP